jgi:hypothetical protein
VAHPLKNPHGLDLAELYPDLHRVWQTHLANRALINELVEALEHIADRIDQASGSPTLFTSEEHDRLAALLAKARGERCT